MKRFFFSLSKHAKPVNSPKFAPCEPYSLIHHEHVFCLHLVVKFTVCTRSSITLTASPPPFLSPVCSYLKRPSGISPQKYIMFCTSPSVLIVVCLSREKRYVAKLTERTPIMHYACSVDDTLCRVPLGIVTLTQLHRCRTAVLSGWSWVWLLGSFQWSRVLVNQRLEAAPPADLWDPTPPPPPTPAPAGSTHCPLFKTSLRASLLEWDGEKLFCLCL